MENNEVKLSVEKLDKMFKDSHITWNSIFTEEDKKTLKEDYDKRFEDIWNSNVSVNGIKRVRGVSSTGVISYFVKDVNRLGNMRDSIFAIGAGKPKKSVEDRLLEKLIGMGMSKADLLAKLNAL